MGWEKELFALFDDLEGAAAAAWEAEREAEVLDRAEAEYASVSLGTRLMASVGTEVALDVGPLGRLRGVLDRVAREWCLLRTTSHDWIVVTRHVTVVHDASPRSVPEVAWSPVARLGLGSALRRLAGTGEPCRVHLVGGDNHEVAIVRVGGDFVEVRTVGGQVVLVPFEGLVAVQGSEGRDSWT